jgi:hypothetical protein
MGEPPPRRPPRRARPSARSRPHRPAASLQPRRHPGRPPPHPGRHDHARKIVTVITENNSFRLVIDGETVAVVPRTTSREIDRYKAYATPPQGVNPMPEVKLDAADAAELAECCNSSAADWPAALAASLDEYADHPGYDIQDLRGDLERLVFLLGGSDGEPLFGHLGTARLTKGADDHGGGHVPVGVGSGGRLR